MPSIVTLCASRDWRLRAKPPGEMRDEKRRAHHRHRRAWRVWCDVVRLDEDAPEPEPRPLTGWDIV